MWATGVLLLLLLLATAQLALAVDGSRDAFRQRVCMVSDVGSAADSRASRVWWWVRFLLQELLDWAISLTASAAAIAACAVLLRRTDPQPAPRPRVVTFLAEALQGGKLWASIPRRFHFGFVTTTPDRRQSRGVQTPSCSTLNEGASSEETVSLRVKASLEGNVENPQVQEETESVKENTSLVEVQKKAFVEDLQEIPPMEELQQKPPMETPDENVSLDGLQEKVPLEVLHEKTSLEVLHGKSSLEVQHRKPSLEMLHEKPSLEVQRERPSLEVCNVKSSLDVQYVKPSLEVQHEKRSLEVLHGKSSLEVQHRKPSLEMLHEKPSLEVQREKPSLGMLHETASLEVLHERGRLEVVEERPSLEERASLEKEASLEENVPEVTLPEATARSSHSHSHSRSSREGAAQETRENLSQTSEGCVTLYRTPTEGQESPSRAMGPSEQLVATLAKYLDAVVTELRVTNSRLACVLPNLEHAVKQPKKSREQIEALSRTASAKSSRSSSGAQPVPEMEAAASSKRFSPTPSTPSDHGDSDASIAAGDGSEAQTSVSWLQAQEVLAEERRVHERRVIALERRLRDVLSELHLTRCQLAEALTGQDFRGRQVPRIDVRSESSVSLVSSTMDAMLSTASVASDDDSDSETRSGSSASVSPKSTCTVVYRTKHRTAVHSSVSSASVVASESFTSACTMVEVSEKDLPQDKKTRSSPALSTSLLDITGGESQTQSKTSQQQKSSSASEKSSESSFVSSLSESEATARDRPASSSWTQMSGNWLRAMQQLVQQLRKTPQQSQSSDETTEEPEPLSHSSEQPPPQQSQSSPPDTIEEQSVDVNKTMEPQPVSMTTASEVSYGEDSTSAGSLLSRMVNALMSTPSTTTTITATSVLESGEAPEVTKAPSAAVVPSTADSKHTDVKAATPSPSSDHTSSVPPTEACATGGSVLSRMINALLPSSTATTPSPPPDPLPPTRSSGASSKTTVSDAATSTPARVDSILSARAVVSRVSSMLGLSVERSEPAVPEQSEEPPPPPRPWLLQVADRWMTTTCSPPQPPVS